MFKSCVGLSRGHLLKQGVFCLALFWSLSAGAAESKPEVKDLAEKFQESKRNIIEADTQKRKILGSIYSINQRMKKISREKNNLTDELFHVQDDVKSIAKIIASLEIQIEKQRKQLRRRLRALYKMSGEGYIGMLFSRQSAVDLDETLRYLRIVTENDYRLIRSYQENVIVYQQHRQKLKTQITRLVSIERKIKNQENLLVSEHKAKSEIVHELDRNRVANLNRIRSLRNRTQALREAKRAGSEDWEDLLKPSIFEQKGQLPSPVVGTVVRDFGLIHIEKYKIRLSHKGWRYLAPKGAPVNVIFDGTVVHADPLRGYGQTVIIDHGDHYYSVYSHISRVKVKTGDTLKKGQVFAEAGGSTRRHGEGIYFEIRHFSEPENPANWIAAKEIQISPSTEEKKADVAHAAFE